MSTLAVGTRGSQLALYQTRQVIEKLKALSCDFDFEIKIIKTTGDKITDVPLAKIGDKGLFVKEIEQALLSGDIDFAVHSAKDLPSEMDGALSIAAYLERENPADVLVSKLGGLKDLPEGASVGTSSVRRRAQILAARADLNILDLRGNLDTRLKKVDTPDYDAIVLAYAGLKRLGWEDRITEVLPFDICLPAVGQGALAVQCRINNPVYDIINKLDHSPTSLCVRAERALLLGLGAGCQTPVAALAQIDDNVNIILDALVANLDGTSIIRKSITGDASIAETLGKKLAEEFLNSSAREYLDEVRRSAEPKSTGAA